jgi:hypothetical protein
LAQKHPLVGAHLTLRFLEVDATPDLHEQGEIKATVEAVSFEGSPPAERVTGRVTGPDLMEGLRVVLSTRYEGETMAKAMEGASVGVTASFTDSTGRTVAGGLGEATLKRK